MKYHSWPLGTSKISNKVLGFIATEWAGSTEPGDSYLYRLPEIYSNVSVCPVFPPHFIGKHLNACNEIDNHNRMWQSDLAVDKYWVKQSVCFRLATTVALGMGITDGKIMYCHSVTEINV